MYGVLGCILVAVLYLCTLVLSLGALYKCNTTDPGIIPAVKDPSIDAAKEYCKRLSYRLIDVEYRDQGDQTRARQSPQEYFSVDKFRLVDLEKEAGTLSGGEREALALRTTRLAYCETCEILRPPRAFHCSTCNVCIEVHDHHCPWVGTCVAKRNHRYFALFLLATGLHALHTFSWSLASMVHLGVYFQDPDKLDPHHILRVILVIYTCLFALLLIGFFIAQNLIILNDMTSNEHIRRKWNAGPRRVAIARMRRRQGETPSLWERFKHFYLSEKPESLVSDFVKSKEPCNAALLAEYGVALVEQA
jgi:hypothetical protein